MISQEFELKVQELHNYIDKWAQELREKMQLPRDHDGCVSISFMPEVKLPRVPQLTDIAPGIYMTRSGDQEVEVIDIVQGYLLIEFMNSDGKLMTESISPGAFELLFVSKKTQDTQ